MSATSVSHAAKDLRPGSNTCVGHVGSVGLNLVFQVLLLSTT